MGNKLRAPKKLDSVEYKWYTQSADVWLDAASPDSVGYTKALIDSLRRTKESIYADVLNQPWDKPVKLPLPRGWKDSYHRAYNAAKRLRRSIATTVYLGD